MCVSCDSLDVYEFVDMCITHLRAVCCVCQCGVCHFVELWQCGACAWVGMWVCVAAWQGEEEGSSRPPSPSPHCCAHTHTRTHTYSVPWLRAVEMGGGGYGGSKIKLKIKACPESPSARADWLGGAGLWQLPLCSHWGCVSVCLSGHPARPLPGPQPWPRRPCSPHRSICDQWGQGGARGRARSKGPQETVAGTETEMRRWGDRDRETWRQGCWEERCGDPET